MIRGYHFSFKVTWLLLFGLLFPFPAITSRADEGVTSAVQLSKQVTIHRNDRGVAHILGDTDEATILGAGYFQAEDFFWQSEDTAIQAIGRHAEVLGEKGLQTDLLTRCLQSPAKKRPGNAPTHYLACSYHPREH